MNRLLLAGAALPLLALSTAPAFATATTSFFAPTTINRPLLTNLLLFAVGIFVLLYHFAPRAFRLIPALGFAVVATSLVLLTGPALAASIDIGQALTGSIQDIVNATVTAGIAALVGWVAIVLKNKFNVDIEAQNRAALTAFLQRQASWLISQGFVKVNGLKIDVQSQPLADASNAALSAIPGAMAFFGLTPDSLKQRIIAMIPKEPAVAAAQAVALDVANPATPSRPTA